MYTSQENCNKFGGGQMCLAPAFAKIRPPAMWASMSKNARQSHNCPTV